MSRKNLLIRGKEFNSNVKSTQVYKEENQNSNELTSYKDNFRNVKNII